MNRPVNMNTFYGTHARFDTGRAMTEDELRHAAPSVFALAPHESRSERFKAIPTIEIVRGLAQEGFGVVGARQSNARSEDRRDFTKHMLRIRKMDDTVHRVGDTVFEILLKNANDGTSVYDLMAGLFRSTCLNSMVVQTDTIGELKVRHSGDAVNKVIEGTYKVLDDGELALRAPADWSQLQLDRDEMRALALAARAVRFDDEDGHADHITPEALLLPKRAADRGDNLWMTFNRLQSNCIQGGITGTRRTAEGRQRQFTTRTINGIDQDVKVNKALWILGEEMTRLKAAA